MAIAENSLKGDGLLVQQSEVPITYTEPVEPVEVQDFTSGIIQSSEAPPQLPAFGLSENQWDREDRVLQEEQTQWFSSYQTKLDEAALNPDAFYEGADLSFAEDPKQAQKIATNDAFLTLHNNGEPLPSGELNRSLFRVKVADQMFGGKGADSDEEFHGEIVKAATFRKDSRNLQKDLTGEASKAALAGMVGESGKDPSFAQWREKAATQPGYKPEMEFAYLEAWNESQNAMRDDLAKFREPLAEVWAGFKAGDASVAATDAYYALDPADRPEFMNALAMAGRTLPKDQQPSFWANLLKRSPSRAISGMADNIVTSLARNFENEVAGTVPITDSQEQAKQAFATTARNVSGSLDFVNDVTRIQQSTYDPIKNIQSGALGAIESGAYGAPGAIATTALAAIPLAGQVLTIEMMKGGAYSSVRSDLMDKGMDPQKASEFANDWATPIALIQYIPERIGFETITGNLPAFGKALTAVSDQIQNRIARGVTKTVTTGTVELSTELAQDLVPGFVQEIAGALQEDVPDVVWSNGKDGIFDNYGFRTLETAVAILPLAIFGAAGGLNREARARAFAEATPLQRQAFGITEADSNAIDAAAALGQGSLNSAVDTAMSNRKPQSEEAIIKSAELDAQIAAQSAAAEELKASRMIPDVTRLPDGSWIVSDPETGEEVGTAKTPAEAMALAESHSSAIEERSADLMSTDAQELLAAQESGFRRDILQTSIEGADIAAEILGSENSQTDLKLGRSVTSETVSFNAPQDAARVARQIELEDIAGGGDGSIVRAVWGNSSTETMEDVRQTINSVYEGGSILTVFHEKGHEMRRKAYANGSMTEDAEVSMFQSFDAVLASKASQAGQSFRFLPENFAELSERQQETALDEAFSAVVESEVIRSGRDSKSKLAVPRAVFSRNIKAAAKLMSPNAARSWTSFMKAIRHYWGLAFGRAKALDKAFRDGSIDRESYDDFLSTMLGLNEQDRFNREVVTARDKILDEDNPFSLGPVPITPEQDAAYVAAVESGDMEAAQRMVDDAAKAAGYTTGPLWHGGEQGIESFNPNKGRGRLLSRSNDISAFFTDNPEIADEFNASGEKSGLYRAFVKLDNPAVSEGNTFPGSWNDSKIAQAKKDGHDGIIVKNSMILFDFPEATEVAVFSPNQIKSADPVSYDSEGKPVPLSERFNPNDDRISYSLGPVAMSDALAGEAISRIKNPKQKMAVMQGIASRLSALKRDQDQIGTAFGQPFERKAIQDPRSTASINKESAFREAARRAELEDAAYAKHEGILSNPDLAKLKEQPVHAALSDPSSPLRGRLMSATQAASRGENFFDPKRQGDFDGAGGVSRTLFGGSLMPDQAAQELYDSGLISEPTPDAMWEALSKESASVSRFKDYLKAAEADVKAARVTAKDEAAAWKKDRLAEERQNYSPKSRLIRALQMMDATIAALPIAERGRIGGYTQLAKLGSDEARLEFLKGRIEKADAVVESWLKKEYGKMFDKLLERAEADRKGGEKAKGKLGAEGHRFFDQVRAVTEMSESEIEKETIRIDKELADADPNDTEELADLAEEFQIVNTFGNFSEKSAADMAAAVELAQGIYDSNRNLWKMKEEVRLAVVKEYVSTAIKDLGGAKTSTVQESKAKAAKLLSAVQGGKRSIKSFAEVLEGVFGKDSAITKRWSAEVRKAMARKTTAVLAAQKRWKIAIESATGKSGRAARRQIWEMSTKQTVEATVSPITTEIIKVPINTFFDAANQSLLGLTDLEIAQLTEQFEALPEKSRKRDLKLKRESKAESESAKFTEAEAVYLSMLWSQDGYKDAMRKHGMGEEFQADLEAGMSDAAKELRIFLAGEYANNYEPLREMYAKMFGVDLRQTTNYTPGKFFSTGEDNTLDVTGSGFVDGGLKSGFLKDRKKHSAEARAENAFAVYFNHLNQTEHWKAMAEISREMHGVLGRPLVKKALAAKDPEIAPVLNEWMKAIDGNGFNNPKMSWLLDVITTSQAYLAMSWKLSTIAKNAIGATINAAYRMPVKDYAIGMSRLLSGKLEFSEIWNSTLIQNRLAGGFSPEVRAVIGKAFGSKPTLRGDFLLKGMEVIGTADAFGTAIGAAITYDYHYRNALRSGLSKSDAKMIGMNEAAETISRTAQPVEVSDRSLMELRLNGIGKIAFVFASEARQKSSLWLTAWGNTLTGKPTLKDARVLFLSHVVMAPVMHAIGKMIQDWRDPEGDDDDNWFLDDKYWNPQDFLIAMATGPLAGIPLIRDIFDGYNGESGPLKRIADSGIALKKLFMDEPKGDETDWYERQITKVLQGTVPSVAVAASVFDQIYDFVRNATDD